jgi:hypothetical protein
VVVRTDYRPGSLGNSVSGRSSFRLERELGRSVMAKDDKKVDLDSLVDAVGASKDGELEKNILLSDVDPADGSQEVRENKNNPEIFGGTSAEDLPEAPVDAMYAAQVLAQRAWEKGQGEAAAIPDPEADKAKEAAKADKK